MCRKYLTSGLPAPFRAPAGAPADAGAGGWGPWPGFCGDTAPRRAPEGPPLRRNRREGRSGAPVHQHT
ncbi:hypothetical protein GCM10010446_49580 [Streptomyces enissocaesilis]|uniref:Uncharacterized protein n=1 Tax=Streptomyces enissocaesilis TaxID=332589 RepID=A0ABN3XIC1_9ACTN